MPTKIPPLEITALDKTRAAFDSVKRSLGGLKSSVSAISPALAGAFSVTAITAFGVSMYRAAQEAEKSQNRIAAILKATGSAAGITRGEINKLADELADSTVFDDESIRNAAAALLRFRDIQGNTFREGLRLVPDLAAALGTDVVDAAQSLGRALSDPEGGMRALKAAGVKLSDEQIRLAKSFQDSGDSAGSAKIVIDELRGSIGGAAQGENAGLTKATADLSKAYNELLEAFGQKAAEGGELSFLGKVSKTLKELKTEAEGVDNVFQAFVNRAARNLQAIEGDSIVGSVAGFLARKTEQPRTGKTRPSDSEQDAEEELAGKAASRATAEARAEAAREKAFKLREAAQKAAQQAAMGRAEELKNYVKQLDEERAKLSLSADAFELYKAQKLGARGIVLQNIEDIIQETSATRNRLEVEEKTRDSVGESIDAYLKLGVTQKKYIDDIKAEASLIGLSNNERKLAVKLREIELQHISKTSDEYKNLIPIIRETIIAENFADEIKDQNDRVSESFKSLQQAIEGFGRDASRSLADFIFTGKSGFKDFVRTAIRELGELLIYRNIFEPLVKGFSGGFGGRVFPQQPAAPVSEIDLSRFGKLAYGGPIPANSPRWVGERGRPELFMPNVAGRVIPHDRIGGNTISIYTTVNAGTGQTTTRSEGSANQTSRELSRAVKAAVLDVMQNEKRQGGMLV